MERPQRADGVACEHVQVDVLPVIDDGGGIGREAHCTRDEARQDQSGQNRELRCVSGGEHAPDLPPSNQSPLAKYR